MSAIYWCVRFTKQLLSELLFSFSKKEKNTMESIIWHYGKTTTNALNIRKAPSLSAQRWNNVWPVARVVFDQTD